VVIGADGVQGSIARWSALGQVQKLLSGVQIETAYDVENTDHVEVFLGGDVPGFFAWAVPVSENTARIGLCVDPAKTHLSAYEHLKRFLPFGGVKGTGNGFREAGTDAVREFTEVKAVYFDIFLSKYTDHNL